MPKSTTTSAFTLTLAADSVEQLHQNMRDMIGDAPAPAAPAPKELPFQEFMVLVDKRLEAEGYDMDLWKKGDRPEPELSPAEKRKEEARAKLRGDLKASVVHEADAVKDAVEKEMADATPDELPKIKKMRVKKEAGNGKGESAEDLKQRMIKELGALYATDKHKADVRKILAEFGEGNKTFAAIPAERFAEIEEVVRGLT
jgi:hypothetical protein